jgi:hypothetical protein
VYFEIPLFLQPTPALPLWGGVGITRDQPLRLQMIQEYTKYANTSLFNILTMIYGCNFKSMCTAKREYRQCGIPSSGYDFSSEPLRRLNHGDFKRFQL